MDYPDFEQICLLNTRYAMLFDDRAFEEWIDLFVSDAIFDVRGQEFRGHAGLRQFLETRADADRGKHMPGVPAITRADSGTCAALVDYVYLCSGDTGIRISAGRYHDRLRRDGDRWQFVERRIKLAPGFLPT
jgi:3-phenylpropionate/cinnamic acid dioxygenase small subunit